jgi:transformation/transcription domain-associated protein
LTVTQHREQSDRFNHFQTLVEEALQLALNEWQMLPPHPCPAHAQILHNFQMLVEIQESLALYSNLAPAGGGASNLSRPQFLADLKGLLTAWRERLPNSWDGMDFWSDILAWRQHVFSAINSAFAPLASESSTAGVNPQGQTAATTNASTHPFAFRGYHEMAWLINRFAHVARKNNMTDVCLSFLNRIYTLPNIEIQDAFLKLREQAKCYMDTPADLPTALEVVNATNLNYFSGLQKGEFFALRSVILSRLGMVEEANRVFAQAVQIDLNMGHGWAAWGRFNDQRFSQQQDINLAVNAINCYLQAATLFKAHKSRRFLARILWLLTFEDSIGSLGKSFEMYNHDLPTWFWVSFVPQLLASLARKEQRQARFVLIKIAKNYPQALYLPLRTFHEDCRLQYGSRPGLGGAGKITGFIN